MNQNIGDGKTTDPSWIVKEIQAMMHGFGDSNTPLLASAMLIEEVMVKQLRSAIIQAEEVAEHRGSPVIQPHDFILLMRKDKAKLQRVFKYLNLKELKDKGFGKMSSLADSDFTNAALDCVQPLRKRTQDLLYFICGLDSTFVFKADESNDAVKQERIMRADKMSTNMKSDEYAEYVNSRRASFSNTSAKVELLYKRIFSQEIGTTEEPNVSLECYDVIGYLAYETVQQIMDLALLVRQDSYAKVGDPISRYVPPSLSFPYPVPTNVQVEGAPPVTVAEIREALRRYWSPQFSPFNSGCNIHMRLLAI